MFPLRFLCLFATLRWTLISNAIALPAGGVERQGARVRVSVTAPETRHGLTLRLPTGYRAATVEPSEWVVIQQPGQVVLRDQSGTATLVLERGSGKR